MTRRGVVGLLRVVGLLCATALLLTAAACGEGKDGRPTGPVTFEFSGTAATVDGQDVPAKALADQLDAFRGAPGAVKPAFGKDDFRQAGTDQPEPAIVASLLTTEIFARVVEDELAARGLKVSSELRTVAETQIKAQFGDSLDAAPNLQEQITSRFANYVTLDQALAPPEPDDAAVQAVYDKDPKRWEQVCARHILVAAEAEANNVLAQLQGGANFEALARARSTDTGSGANGGDLGCVPRGQYVAEFEKAAWEGPIGQVQGPVKSEFGYHLILVTKRGKLTLEEARSQIVAELSPEAFKPLSDWLDAKMAGLKVTVDPRFGKWDALAGAVTPVDVRTEGLKISPDSSAATTTSRP